MQVRGAASLVPGLWLLACNSIAPPVTTFGVLSTSTGDAPVMTGDVHANLDFTRPGEPVGDLVGWNLGPGTRYAPENDPLHPEWRTPVKVAAAQALAEARPGHGRAPWMRFAGLPIDGARGGDGYHFYKWVEPGRAAAPGDAMATFEYFALMQDADAAPIVTLNFGSGTAAEAAAYVAHLNGADADDINVAARLHWGQDQPYRQTLFELGSESYGPWNTGHSADGDYAYANPEAKHGGDPAWAGKPSAAAADYAARALEYVAAVKAVEPEARFWVPLAQASMDGWGGVEAAVEGLAPLLRDPSVAGAVVHHYLLDDARTLGWSGPGDLFFTLAGAEAFRPGFARARAALDGVRPGLELVVTEYHVAGTASRGEFTRGQQAAVGLGVAGMLLLYAQLGVEAACQQAALEFESLERPDRDPLLEPWYNPFRAGPEATAAPMASYVATRLVGEHLLERAAPLEFTKQVERDMSFGPDETIKVPLVHAAAFVDPASETGSLVALHRDLQQSHTFTVDLPPGWTATAASQWAPPSAEHNTMYQPVAVEPAPFVQDGERVQLTLPPHSLVAVRFAAAAQ
ncbi:hypothetical protein [Nannocystis bainbridge]|uniref:Alpha-L-arabinofuranosidase C-terminal domain-containing protein n=1 Tax=Nannocystis bainbridge TaxID=2995303 RepID=A0ABT5DTZ7_9BACT|nr:hypothetical protein [Nannocystis bainbridge]MDC0716529.1 hypothetical protein [Nannocystis bainbridge]